MSTKALIPGNSQRARLTALNTFERFATAEHLSVKEICTFESTDTSGDMLYIVLDKFAMYLAFKGTSKGSLLSKNSVASYFGNVKNHLLELYPALNAVSGRRFQKIASILDKYCAKRGSDYTQQAPPCTKADLRALATAILKGATVADDYKDFTLLNLLWYLLGRSSDTLALMKSQVAVYPGGCLYISFKRLKSASNQGASLFHDPSDFSSFPIHALAVATIMQTSPSEFLLDHLPRDTRKLPPVSQTETPLRDLLVDGCVQGKQSTKKVTPVPGMHAYLNRVLQKWGADCVRDDVRLTKGLSSHSFRRGAAQNANGNSDVSTPWILDRGGWSMTAVSKAFNYIVSTTHEDQQVGKTLAGWDLQAKFQLPTLRCFDGVVLHRIDMLQGLLFTTARGLSDAFNFREDVIEVMTAVALLHYHDILQLAPDSPYIKRVRQALGQLPISENEVIAWALTICGALAESERTHSDDSKSKPAHSDPKLSTTDALLQKQFVLIEQQTQLIASLSLEVSSLNKRVESLEDPSSASRVLQDCVSSRMGPSKQLTSPARTRSRSKQLASVWYEWFCDLLPFARKDRRRYHECKVTVAFMRVFLLNGYDTTGSDSVAKARILELGRTAQAGIHAFLEDNKVKAKSVGTTVKILKRMHAEGKLNCHINRYLKLVDEGLVADVTPPKSVHELLPRFS